jgi:thiol:disulfide interchange protein DsbD
MWSFALGMGTLFLFIGTFSGAVVLLPKSGPWMARLKQFFGGVMLGAALYYAAPLLPGNVLLLCIGAYLIGIGTFIGGWDAMAEGAGGFDRLRKSAGILCLTLGMVYAARFAFDGAARPPLPTPADPAGIVWIEDEAEALRAAGRENKPLLIDFYADWCAACKALDRRTFADPAVVAAARSFVPLRVDSSDPGDPAAAGLHRKYGIVGLPTILFVGDGGRVIHDETITEFVPAARLLEGMTRVAAAAGAPAAAMNLMSKP